MYIYIYIYIYTCVVDMYVSEFRAVWRSTGDIEHGEAASVDVKNPRQYRYCAGAWFAVRLVVSRV